MAKISDLTVTVKLDPEVLETYLGLVARKYRVKGNCGLDYCFWCERRFNGEAKHTEDCPHVKAKKILVEKMQVVPPHPHFDHLRPVEPETRCQWVPGSPECGCEDAAAITTAMATCAQPRRAGCNGTFANCQQLGNTKNFGGHPKDKLTESQRAEVSRAIQETLKRKDTIDAIAAEMVKDQPRTDNMARCGTCGTEYLHGAMCPKCFGEM
jgi:hypothetical protein